jgi:MFS family permease
MIGIFSIYVPPYCMPTFAESIGLSSSTGAGLVAGFNAASAVGRITSGFISDKVGPINVLCTCLAMLGTSMFVIWPFASTLGVVILFVLISGFTVGGIVSMFPTVVGHLFGSANMSVTMGMILTSWSFGYTLVSLSIGYKPGITLTIVTRVHLLRATFSKRAEEPTTASDPTDLPCTSPDLWL